MTSENSLERPHSPAIRTKMAASNTLKILLTKPNFSKTKNIRRKLIPVPKSHDQNLSSKQHLFWGWSIPLSLASSRLFGSTSSVFAYPARKTVRYFFIPKYPKCKVDPELFCSFGWGILIRSVPGSER